MKIINIVLKLISIIIGIIVGTKQLINGTPIGDTLISLSLIIIVLMPNILRKWGIKIKPIIELIFLLFIFFAQTLGSVLDFYQKYYFYDKVVHFSSGLVTSFLGIYILVILNIYNKKNFLFNFVMIIFTSMAIAGFWEIFEFTCNSIFGGDAQKVMLTGVNDTMTDIIVALLGSLLVSVLYMYEEQNDKKIIVKRFIAELK